MPDDTVPIGAKQSGKRRLLTAEPNQGHQAGLSFREGFLSESQPAAFMSGCLISWLAGLL